MTLRERLVAWLSDAFTRAALIAAPKPKVPMTRRFMVEVSDPNYLSDLTVELLFVPQSEMPAAEWHVITITQYPGEKPLLLDSAVGRCYVWHLQETTDIETLIKVFQPDYRVTVCCPSKGHMLHGTIGPTTCITLAKRLVGVHNPGIVTSRQLLALLWERSNGRDQGHRRRHRKPPDRRGNLA